MVRFLLEKSANFTDIERIVLNKEELAIDSTVHKKCGKPGGEALTAEQIQEAIDKIENNTEMSCINCGVKACGLAKRSIIYSLICAVNQLKKAFNLEILQYFVNLLNSTKIVGNRCKSLHIVANLCYSLQIVTNL